MYALVRVAKGNGISVIIRRAMILAVLLALPRLAGAAMGGEPVCPLRDDWTAKMGKRAKEQGWDVLEMSTLDPTLLDRMTEREMLMRSILDADTLEAEKPSAFFTSQADLASLGASRIVYLSCDPATLARDAAVLCARGYTVVSVEGFDLFPQTPHVEALLVLEIG